MWKLLLCLQNLNEVANMVVGTIAVYLLGILMVIFQYTLIPYWFSASGLFLPQLAEAFAIAALLCDKEVRRSGILAMLLALLSILGFAAEPISTIVVYTIFVAVCLLFVKQKEKPFARTLILIAVLCLVSSLGRAVWLMQKEQLLSFQLSQIGIAAASAISTAVFAVLFYYPVAWLCSRGKKV